MSWPFVHTIPRLGDQGVTGRGECCAAVVCSDADAPLPMQCPNTPPFRATRQPFEVSKMMQAIMEYTTQSLVRAHTLTRTLALTRTHSRTHSRTRTRTRTHTHALADAAVAICVLVSGSGSRFSHDAALGTIPLSLVLCKLVSKIQPVQDRQLAGAHRHRPTLLRSIRRCHS